MRDGHIAERRRDRPSAPARGKVLASGEDRARRLHALTTNHVEGLAEAGVCLIFLLTGGKTQLIRQLETAGIDGAGAEDARVVRLEHGRPCYGEDITEEYVPQETQLLRAVHFNKGCYIGQAIVERIRSRGHVNRLLVRLAIDAAHPPAGGAAASGTEFLVDGAPAKVVAFDSVAH